MHDKLLRNHVITRERREEEKKEFGIILINVDRGNN